MSIVTIVFGIYIGTSVSAYVANIIHPGAVVGVTKVGLSQPKTVVTTPTTTAPVTKTTTKPTPTTTVTQTKVTTSPAPIPTPTPIVVPAPSSDVTSLAPAPSTTTTNNSGSTTSYTSTNWSGYLATTGSFTSISGTWTVARPTGNGTSTTSDAAWIGIGGVSTADLIQVGTDNTVSASGAVTTSAFYELLPAVASPILTMIVQPGDSMQASLSDANGQWTIVITDLTNTQTFTKVVAYSSSLSSAEWIEEDPFYANGTQVPFDTFGSVNFAGSLTTNNGTSVNLSGVGASKITMVNQAGTPIAVPSVIGNDGASFTVTSQ
ncbi:MAG: Peptidase family [Candidatus Saccharibacteria bacterium]|nr:Peptidase family [Candidatus Saccharibacteria bacterium]